MRAERGGNASWTAGFGARDPGWGLFGALDAKTDVRYNRAGLASTDKNACFTLRWPLRNFPDEEGIETQKGMGAFLA